MPVIDLDTAKTLVKQFYPNATDPALESLLEASKSKTNYRPYIVAAFFILTEYRRILKAEDVTFDYNTTYTIQGLLTTQKAIDCNDLNIDECWQVDTILNQLNQETSDSNSVVSAFVV